MTEDKSDNDWERRAAFILKDTTTMALAGEHVSDWKKLKTNFNSSWESQLQTVA